MTTKTRREQELEREVKTLRALLAANDQPGQGESEELLRLAYDAADLGIWENDLRTGRVFFDERARVHYGFDTGNITLADVIARVHPDDAGRLRQEIAAATAPTSDGRYLTEYRVLHPDGTVRWLRVHVRVHFEGQGAARRSIKGIGTSQDITERKRAEEILRESEERYHALFEQAYDAILIANEADEIIDANRRACELYGYSRPELLAMRVPDLQAPQVRGTAGSVVKNELARHGTTPFETVDVRRDGALILVEVNISRITRPGGDLYISIIRDITGLKQAERTLRELADNMAAAQRLAHFGSWEIRLTRELELVDPQFWSDECYRIFGAEPGSIEITQELFYSRVHPDDREPAQQALVKALQERTVTTYEYRIIQPGGAMRYLQDQVQVLVDECTGQPVKLIGTVQDVTERKQAEVTRAELETQLRQAQKLESIGRLAGGVAHDFNNLLTVIQGHASLLLAGRPGGDPLFDDLEQIRLAAERAAALTRQLLAFSRRQLLAPATIDLNSLVADLDKLLRRLIGEDISLTTFLQPDLRPILADPGQVEQVIMNLVVNARDAMPTGGRLTIETSNIYLDDSYTATRPDVFSGPGVLLAVTDTGCGMDEATMAQIFEPFFTTKEPGKGTGLGLATVYGIVKQSRGDITVSSQPDRGTSFKLYFPAGQPAAGQAAPEPQPAARRGSETILLVEDEEMVRSLVGRVLEAEGYRLLEARRGEEALALLEQHPGAINLLLTDVVMPGMSSRELAERLKTLRPQAKVLFMSGYADDAVVRHGVLMAEVEFLAKPFSPDQLVARVRQVLDK